MVQLNFVHWGAPKTPGLALAAAHYLTRLKPWAKIAVVELDSENDRVTDARRVCDQLTRSKARAHAGETWVLTEYATPMGTPHWVSRLRQQSDRGSMSTWVLGPAQGLDLEVLSQADIAFKTVSLAPMTLNHELAWVVLLEQVYRALSVLHHHPYHRA